MAMTLDDIKMIQTYFRKDERRNPTETELKVLDTYWSDHCRHTTFETLNSKCQNRKWTFSRYFTTNI